MSSEARREAEAWLRKADSDLRTVEILLRDPAPPLDSVCYHTQQAAEKALKGLLTLCGVPFPKTHDLVHLASLVPEDVSFEVELDVLVELSYFAVGPRYPDDLTVYTRAMAEALREKALRVYAAAVAFF